MYDGAMAKKIKPAPIVDAEALRLHTNEQRVEAREMGKVARKMRKQAVKMRREAMGRKTKLMAGIGESYANETQNTTAADHRCRSNARSHGRTAS